ncbi:periplasmic heavy metal sensor [Myxococcus qinghaiensis]|uniref:periplasmic heavy metal sensor n=1 Tax=Myxococcus qinghaiensis TaxID=2906758 RepID=UPI0020A78F7E|nr:periplasmic heavy metal sensor [Myxococcus qinghaiensis]MCP3167100.1 periplasmic heavy metal sensor [Myxococcus qinghaiensis]
MKKTRVTALLTAALAPLLLSSTSALAQPEDDFVLHRAPPGATMIRVGPGGDALPPGQFPAAAHGIPPHLVEKLGVPRELAKQVQELTFDANEAIIPLEADLKRAQIQLERLLSADSTDENAVLKQVEEVGRAETAVRRNRLGLMVRIKKLLGPELWRKLEAEMGSVRIQKRIEIRKGPPGDDGPGTPAPPPPPRKP